MTQLNAMEQELAGLMVESLNLEMAPDAIDPDAPLYREGLGLDSIDLLELSVVVSKNYGFQLKSDDPEITNIFSSLRTLAKAVESRRSV
jgi:acyl carrier protein